MCVPRVSTQPFQQTSFQSTTFRHNKFRAQTGINLCLYYIAKLITVILMCILFQPENGLRKLLIKNAAFKDCTAEHIDRMPVPVSVHVCPGQHFTYCCTLESMKLNTCEDYACCADPSVTNTKIRSGSYIIASNTAWSRWLAWANENRRNCASITQCVFSQRTGALVIAFILIDVFLKVRNYLCDFAVVSIVLCTKILC